MELLRFLFKINRLLCGLCLFWLQDDCFVVYAFFGCKMKSKNSVGSQKIVCSVTPARKTMSMDVWMLHIGDGGYDLLPVRLSRLGFVGFGHVCREAAF